MAKACAFLALCVLFAAAAAQSIRTINGSIVMEIAGATMTLQGAAPSQQAASLLEPAAYFQPQVNNLYGVLNATDNRVAQTASTASALVASEASRALGIEASLAASVSGQAANTAAQVANAMSRAMNVESSLAQSVSAALASVPSPVSAAVAAETTRASSAEAALGVLVGQTQASVAQASAGVASIASTIDGRFSTSLGALSAVLGGQLGANLAQTAGEYSRALFTSGSMAAVASTQMALINTQLSTNLAALSTATAATFTSTTTTLSSAIASTVSAAQLGLSTTQSAAAAALSAGAAATQASVGAVAAQATATATSLQTTIANLSALWSNYTAYAVAQSTRVATLAASLSVLQATVTQNLVCSGPPPAVANGVVSSCTNVPVGGTCVPTCNPTFAPLFAYTCSLGGVWTGTASCGNGLTINTPLASCLAIRNNGQTTTGIYFVNPIPGGIPLQVHCDMTTDGGGWTFAALITGFDQNHSNVNSVGILPVTPTSAFVGTGSTNPMSQKLADNVINALMSNPQGPAASLRFVCNNFVTYIKNCVWRATKGLSYTADPCTTLYTDAAATVVYSAVACNSGSQGVGAHCGGTGPLPPNAMSYCSHCINGDGAFLPAGRLGCGNDGPVGYGRAGQLWVR